MHRTARLVALVWALLAVCFSSLAQPAQELRLVRGVISSVAGDDGRPIPASAFHIQDHIYYFSEFSWADPAQPGGNHQLLYKWYSGDKLALSFGDTKAFDAAPYHWFAYVTGGHLGEGHHRAELYVDGKLFDSSEFDIVPESTAIAAPAVAVTDENSLRDAIKMQGMGWLVEGDTEAFDQTASRFRESRERSPAGIWKLSLLYNCLQKLKISDPKDPEWGRLEGIAARWRESRPDSPTAVIVSAKLLHAHAWTWRGDGYASEVSQGNWPPYQELIEQERKLLDEHRETAQRDPEWAATRISVANEQGEDKEAILEMATAALDREPHYYPIHYAATGALVPRWGGSEELIKRYVQLAMERSRPQEGTQAYARIYFDVARNVADPVKELNETGAKWPATLQSLDEILRAYPDPFNREMARSLTCLAGDREAYKALGRHNGTEPAEVAWFDTPQQRQQCDAWAFEGKDMPTGSVMDQALTYLSFLRGFGAVFWWRVKLAGLALFLTLELVLWLRAHTERQALLMRPAAAGRGFDPALYPRSYRFSGGAQTLSNHSAIALAATAGASAWALTTIPWPDSGRTLAVFLLLVLAALAGLLFLLKNLVSCVVLQAGAIEVHGLTGMRSLHRGLLKGWRMRGKSIVLETLESGTRPLTIREVAHADEAFQSWFAPLPRLDTAQRNELNERL